MRKRRVVCVAGLLLASTTSFGRTTATAAPAKPNGLQQIIASFGQACNANAQANTVSFPYQAWNGSGASVNYVHHSLIHSEVQIARWYMNFDAQALYYGGGMYFCRKKTGSTSQWSVHAWGIAVDTNTAVNPQGTGCCWNGLGHDGNDHGLFVPDGWTNTAPGWNVNFTWGKSWNDLHHFQYATGY